MKLNAVEKFLMNNPILSFVQKEKEAHVEASTGM